MELTKDDIGRTVLWLSGAARLAMILELNPADDNDVLVAPDSGGRVWVNPAELFPVKAGNNPTAVAALINVAQDLVEYDKLKTHVREFLDALDRAGTGWSYAVGSDAVDAVLQLRQDVRVAS